MKDFLYVVKHCKCLLIACLTVIVLGFYAISQYAIVAFNLFS